MVRIALLAFLLVACSPPEPTIKYEYIVKEVKIPVAVRPEAPPVVVRPHLPIHDLTKEDYEQENYEKIGKAYKVSIVELQKHIKELDALLDTYRYTDK